MYKSSVEAAYFCLWLAGDLILVLFLNPTKLQLFHVNHMMMAFPARRTSDTPELSNWLCWLGYLAILRYFYLSIRYWTWYLSYYLNVSNNSSNVKSKGEHPSFLLKAVWLWRVFFAGDGGLLTGQAYRKDGQSLTLSSSSFNRSIMQTVCNGTLLSERIQHSCVCECEWVHTNMDRA